MVSSFVNMEKRIYNIYMDAMDDPQEAAEKIVVLEDRVQELAAENLSLQMHIDAFKFFEDSKVEKKREFPASIEVSVDDEVAAKAILEKLEGLLGEIIPGSIVRLKSGGPDMTVDAVCSDGKNFNCHWFDEFGNLVFHTFRRSALEPVK